MPNARYRLALTVLPVAPICCERGKRPSSTGTRLRDGGAERRRQCAEALKIAHAVAGGDDQVGLFQCQLGGVQLEARLFAIARGRLRPGDLAAHATASPGQGVVDGISGQQQDAWQGQRASCAGPAMRKASPAFSETTPVAAA